ncbi:MAG: hypothetical protein KatS3mg102_1382 [Planctomycetota bacterium]|nr:MAG: hypothetical protein KatS3mg102_1382 [Planctomycetota bacterium]
MALGGRGFEGAPGRRRGWTARGEAGGSLSDGLAEVVRLALARVQARAERCGPGSGGGGAGPEPAGAGRAGDRRAGGGPVAIASDHGGFRLKQELVAALRERGYEVVDLGPAEESPCDYPDQALAVARAVAAGQAWRGIVLDGVGIGSAIAANKLPGVRAAVCWEAFGARNARAHNDANVLCLGGRVLGGALAAQIAELFLQTEFEGGRHQRRVDKIAAIERAALGAAAAGVRA